MKNCELCGVSFEPAPDLVEVTTTRTLCAACAADHARRRAAKAKGALARERQPQRDVHGGATDERLAGRRRAAADRKRRQTLIGMASIAGVLLVGGSGLSVWLHNSAVAEAAAAARQLEAEQVAKELLAYNPDAADTQARFIQRAKATAEIWGRSPAADQIAGLLRRAENGSAARAEHEKVAAELAAIQQAMAAATTTGQVAALIAQLHAAHLPKGAADLHATAKGLLYALDHALGEHVVQDAAALAGKPAGAAELAQCRSLESALVKALENAGDLEPAQRQELKTDLERVAGTTDKFATALAVPGSEGPWTDIGAKAVADWHPSQTPGFAVAAVGSALEISGPSADHKGLGLAVLRKHEPLSDCEVELQCQIDSGSATIYFRLGQKSDRKIVPVVDLQTKSDAQDAIVLAAGQPGTVRVRIVGSALDATGESGATGSLHHAILPTTRTGGLGIATTPGSKVRIQHIAVRRLP